MGSAVTVDEIPDECLASIFRLLPTVDRSFCSLVCRRWLKIEGQSHHRLYLTPPDSNFLSSIFSRFDSVTELTLNCQLVSIGDEALSLVSQRCPNITSLTIRFSHATDTGLESFARNHKALRKFSCECCDFGYKGLNALVHHCGALEQLSVTYLHGITDGVEGAVTASSLKAVCLQDIVFFHPILGANNLTILKLVRCYGGKWDKLLHLLVDRIPSLVEVHLEKLRISDVGLKAISKCSSLETLHLVKNDKCSDAGLVAVAEGCKLLRKLHVDGWEANRIRDRGLIAVAERCPDLQELLLIGMNPTKATLELLASNCRSLERLALCGRSMIGNTDLSDIAAKLFSSDGCMRMLNAIGVSYWIKGNVNPNLGGHSINPSLFNPAYKFRH
ncbi:F-box protein SKIP2 [Spatholobus suberectus]|nr:F-box protein SKIP2 [Spatholobus suberectus]